MGSDSAADSSAPSQSLQTPGRFRPDRGTLTRMSDELKVEKYHEGTGEPAQTGKMVKVHYTGTLENGQKFDSSRDRGQTSSFRWAWAT